MRPEEARRLINKAFRPFYCRSVDLELHLAAFKTKRVKRAVLTMLDNCLLHDKRLAREDNCAYEEAPMYYPDCLGNIDSVRGQMFYISDRWCCTGRLKFLLAVIEK